VRDDVAALHTRMAAVLAENLRRLEHKMDEEQDGDFNKDDCKHAQTLARSIAAFGAEVRKSGATVEDEAKKMTPERRAEIAERWLARLPKELLRPIVERLSAAMKS
jgi:hypothetical protein